MAVANDVGEESPVVQLHGIEEMATVINLVPVVAAQAVEELEQNANHLMLSYVSLCDKLPPAVCFHQVRIVLIRKVVSGGSVNQVSVFLVRKVASGDSVCHVCVFMV